RVPSGVDHASTDVPGRATEGGSDAGDDPAQRRDRARRRHHRRPCSGARCNGKSLARSRPMITHRTRSSGFGTLGRAQRLHHAAMTPFRESHRTALDIGLINNMPDAALDATERQFRALLSAAAGDIAVRLTLYSLPEVPRTDFGTRQVSRYSNFDTLWNSHHDGLTV